MNTNRPPRRVNHVGMWIEYILILVLLILIIAIIVSLLGPYVSNQITQFLAEIANRPAR